MLAEPEPLAAIKETYRVLNTPLKDISIKQEIPPELTAALEQNTFYFSGFKTHHELVEASRLLKDTDGNFKPFNRYLKDIETIDKTYNKNYLRSEYNFATASTQMAVKWKEWEQDGDDYDLQYRTAGDDRVREEHAALDKTTLPPSDPFWDSYLPPNGWNCRCTTVQVRKGKYPQSNSDKAIAAGANCTAKPKQQIFRFNPGKQEKIFPPKHPYYKAPEEVKETVEKIVEDNGIGNVVNIVRKQIIAKDKAKTVSTIKKNKETMPQHNGVAIENKNFETGKMTVLRNSLDKIYEHAIESDDIRKWLQSYDINSFKTIKYNGWAYNRPYTKDHPKFDPKNPNKSKHDNDTYWFNYYTININKRAYWVNVKMHKDFGETIYTIESKKPTDLIKGHKKK